MAQVPGANMSATSKGNAKGQAASEPQTTLSRPRKRTLSEEDQLDMDTFGTTLSPDSYQSDKSTGRSTSSSPHDRPAPADTSSNTAQEAMAENPVRLNFYESRSLFSGSLQTIIEQLARHNMVPEIQAILDSTAPRQDPAMSLFQPASPQAQADMLASISKMAMTVYFPIEYSTTPIPAILRSMNLDPIQGQQITMLLHAMINTDVHTTRMLSSGHIEPQDKRAYWWSHKQARILELLFHCKLKYAHYSADTKTVHFEALTSGAEEDRPQVLLIPLFNPFVAAYVELHHGIANTLRLIDSRQAGTLITPSTMKEHDGFLRPFYAVAIPENHESSLHNSFQQRPWLECLSRMNTEVDDNNGIFRKSTTCLPLGDDYWTYLAAVTPRASSKEDNRNEANTSARPKCCEPLKKLVDHHRCHEQSTQNCIPTPKAMLKVYHTPSRQRSDPARILHSVTQELDRQCRHSQTWKLTSNLPFSRHLQAAHARPHHPLHLYLDIQPRDCPRLQRTLAEIRQEELWEADFLDFCAYKHETQISRTMQRAAELNLSIEMPRIEVLPTYVPWRSNATDTSTNTM